MSDKCFKIIGNQFGDGELGRYMIALRDIRQGEIIIDEPPLVSGPVYIPGDFMTSYCISCFKKCCITVGCEICRMKPFCSEVCSKAEIHKENECRVIREKPEILVEINSNCDKVRNNFIVLCRGVNYWIRAQAKFNEIGNRNPMNELQSKWMQFQTIGAFQSMEVIFQKLTWDLFSEQPNENTLNNDVVEISKHCLGVMKNNGFSHLSSNFSFQGLYFLSSFMQHSCIPNTDRLFDSVTGNMVTIASSDIPKDNIISTSYISLLNNYSERQEELSRNWLFICRCSRCLDLTENDSNLESYKCLKCQKFTLTLRKSPIEKIEKCSKCLNFIINYHNSEWYKCLLCEEFNLRKSKDIKCSTCNETISNNQIELMHEIESSKPLLKNEGQFEDWLETKKNELVEIFHPNHSVFIQIKCFLAQSFGRTHEGISKISDLKLDQKITYCRQVIHVIDLILPPNGIYFLKGSLLFELWSSLREKRRRQPQLLIDDSEVKEIGQKAFQILKFSIPNTSERLMATTYDNIINN